MTHDHNDKGRTGQQQAPPGNCLEASVPGKAGSQGSNQHQGLQGQVYIVEMLQSKLPEPDAVANKARIANRKRFCYGSKYSRGLPPKEPTFKVLLYAAATAVAAAGEEAAPIFTQLTEATKFAVLSKTFQTTKSCAGVMEEVFIIAREEAGVALRNLVGIVTPGKALHQSPPHQKAGYRDKTQPDHHKQDKKELKDGNIPELHILNSHHRQA